MKWVDSFLLLGVALDVFGIWVLAGVKNHLLFWVEQEEEARI